MASQDSLAVFGGLAGVRGEDCERADPVSCTGESLIFAGISEDGAVAFAPPYSITPEWDVIRHPVKRPDQRARA